MFSIFEQYPLGVKNPDGSLNSSESLRNAPNSAFLAADDILYHLVPKPRSMGLKMPLKPMSRIALLCGSKIDLKTLGGLFLHLPSLNPLKSINGGIKMAFSLPTRSPLFSYLTIWLQIPSHLMPDSTFSLMVYRTPSSVS